MLLGGGQTGEHPTVVIGHCDQELGEEVAAVGGQMQESGPPVGWQQPPLQQPPRLQVVDERDEPACRDVECLAELLLRLAGGGRKRPKNRELPRVDAIGLKSRPEGRHRRGPDRSDEESTQPLSRKNWRVWSSRCGNTGRHGVSVSPTEPFC